MSNVAVPPQPGQSMPDKYCTKMQHGTVPGIGSVSPQAVLNSSAVYRFARDENLVDLDELRARLHKMEDTELLAFGNAAKNMCSPRANFGKPPRQPFVIQLQEARAEWRRREGQTMKPELPAMVPAD